MGRENKQKIFGSNEQIRIRRCAYIWFAVIDFGHYGIARFNGSLGSVWYSGHSHFQYRFTCQIMVRIAFLNYQRHAWKTALSLPRVAWIQFWQRDNIFVFVSSDFFIKRWRPVVFSWLNATHLARFCWEDTQSNHDQMHSVSFLILHTWYYHILVQYSCTKFLQHEFLSRSNIIVCKLPSLFFFTHCGLMTVNIGSGNGLLPDGTKPLPESMMTYHQ